MPISSERQLLEKADLTIQNLLNDGGLLPPEVAQQFYRKIMDVTTVFNNVRQVPMARNEMRIPTIISAGRMLQVARNQYTAAAQNNDVGLDWGYGTPNRGLAASERAGLTTGLITMKTDEVIAVFNLTYEMLEDVVEGGSLDANTDFQTLVLDIMAHQIALDLEEKLVNGDTTSGDAFLALQDGIVKLASQNLVNNNGAPISPLLFAQMIKSLPVQYRARLANYKFYVNANVELDYRAQVAQRQTSLGDAMLSSNVPLTVLGVPMVRMGYMTADTMILTDPRNILFGVQRKFRLATERWEEMRLIKIIVTMRIGQTVEDPAAMVKATNVGTFVQ
jgi:HK97 family phage major capsid protein